MLGLLSNNPIIESKKRKQLLTSTYFLAWFTLPTNIRLGTWDDVAGSHFGD